MTQTTTPPYSTNAQPKIGDKVCFLTDMSLVMTDKATHEVTAVGGGRLGNKVSVKPIGVETFSREYYYYCLVPMPE